jgi:hypothetical protein
MSTLNFKAHSSELCGYLKNSCLAMASNTAFDEYLIHESTNIYESVVNHLTIRWH